MTHQFGVLRAPRAVLFGAGQRFSLGRVARPLGKRALVCTDARFRSTQDCADLLELLSRSGVEYLVFDATEAELPLSCILACRDLAADFHPDMVIGIGGGSCLDLAKVVSLSLVHTGAVDTFYGENKVSGPILPVIAIPTTAGTGSEVTPVAVLGDPDRALKVGISSLYLIPHTAICDPELTLSCPPGLTAIAGADALTHAIEAFSATRREPDPEIAFDRVFVGKNALSDMQALAAIFALTRWLPVAVEDGGNLAARGAVMAAAMQAGLAFGVAGTAAAHAIQYPVGALTHTAHGLGVAVLMPYVMAYNRPSCTAEFAEIARAMGCEGSDEAALADDAIDAVAKLFDRIRIPARLSELGVTEDRLDWIAEQSLLATRLTTNNPRLFDIEAARSMIGAAFSGDRSWRSEQNQNGGQQ